MNAIIPTALTRMIATIPRLQPYAEAAERGDPLPESLRAKHGIGLPEDVASLAVFLASQPGRAVTGQCIGIGGDRLAPWSHPAEIRNRVLTGGWSAEAIAATWDDLADGALQPFGAQLDFDR